MEQKNPNWNFMECGAFTYGSYSVASDEEAFHSLVLGRR
jgi:hypothetical protein